MTLIAGMRFDDHLLLASDSLITEAGGLKTRRPKVRLIGDLPLAVAFCGDESIFDRICRDLQSVTLEQMKSADDFSDRLAGSLATYNGRRRAHRQQSGVPTSADDVCSLLVAGYFAGELILIDFDNAGTETRIVHDALFANGAGKVQAETILVAYRDAGVNTAPSQELLERLMTLAIAISPGCEPPVCIARVDAQGARWIKDGAGLTST